MPHIETRDGVRLYVKVWGEGRPVVLIHGWPLTADSWDSIAMSLAARGYKAISYDRRGFGRSDQPWSGYDYDALSDDLADVMAATDASANATLVGFSMGGGEVARYMSRHGGRGVVSSALISSVTPFMLETQDNPVGVPQKEFDKIADGVREDRAGFMRQILQQFYGGGLLTSAVSDAVLDWSWQMCLQAGLRPTLACVTAFSRTDFRGDLASFSRPTLIVHGADDSIVPIDASARPAAKAIGKSQLIEYEGAPHGLLVTHRERLTRDLLAFLENS